MSRCPLILLVLAGCDFSLTPGGSIDAPIIDVAIDALIDARAPDACRAAAVAASGAHSCARMETGDVWCWGNNRQGEVGLSPERTCTGGTACNPTPGKVPVPPVTGLGLGDQHTCAIAGSATYCWGANDSGQFGNASGDASTPTEITQRAGASAIAAGETHTCSLHGTVVRCSGLNNEGQVGDGTRTQRLMPIVTINGGASAIGSGFDHACAVSNGSVQCWGDNADEQIDQMASDALVPRTIVGIANATAVAAGASHTCALLAGGDVRCWGANSAGQLGLGHTNPVTTVATPLINGIVEIGAGVNHTCARGSGGTVFCWGESYTPMPSVVQGLPFPAVSIAVGSYHECYALEDGSVWCGGWNVYGQRGIGTITGEIMDPPTRATLCP